MSQSTNQRTRTLNQLRKRIDRIDRKLLGLLSDRAALAVRIGTLKRKEGLPVFDRRREAQVLSRLSRRRTGKLPASSIRKIFQEILGENRKLQISRKNGT